MLHTEKASTFLIPIHPSHRTCLHTVYAHPLCASERWLLLPSGLLPAYSIGMAGLESLQRLASGCQRLVDMNGSSSLADNLGIIAQHPKSKTCSKQCVSKCPERLKHNRFLVNKSPRPALSLQARQIDAQAWRERVLWTFR